MEIFVPIKMGKNWIVRNGKTTRVQYTHAYKHDKLIDGWEVAFH